MAPKIKDKKATKILRFLSHTEHRGMKDSDEKMSKNIC